MEITYEPIIVEQTFNASVETVWEAITNPDQMKKWFFEPIESFKPEIGFETQFNVQLEDRNFLHLWRLTEVEPLKKIVYNWKYGGYPGDSTVTFELSGQDNEATLRVTHEGGHTFPQDIPEFKRESGVAGWKYFIQQSLKAFLEGE